MRSAGKELNLKKVIFVSWCLTSPLTLFICIYINGALIGTGLAIVFSVPIAIFTILFTIIWGATLGVVFVAISRGIWDLVQGWYDWLKSKALSLWDWLHR